MQFSLYRVLTTEEKVDVTKILVSCFKNKNFSSRKPLPPCAFYINDTPRYLRNGFWTTNRDYVYATRHSRYQQMENIYRFAILNTLANVYGVNNDSAIIKARIIGWQRLIANTVSLHPFIVSEVPPKELAIASDFKDYAVRFGYTWYAPDGTMRKEIPDTWFTMTC